MDPQNKQYNNNSAQNQPVTPTEPVQVKSRLSLVGLVFAIVCPPVGLIISIIALTKIKRNHLRGKGQAIFGIVWGTIFTLPLLILLWLLFALGSFKGNGAKKAAKPFIVQIQKAGGKELCENGDNGYGIDNTQPWYEVYYEIPYSPDLTATIKLKAAQIGYPLKSNTDLINQLKLVPDNNGTVSEPYGGATFNSKTDYLTSEENGKSLKITIYRDASVALYCGVKDYGKKQDTGSNNAILDIALQLPDRNNK